MYPSESGHLDTEGKKKMTMKLKNNEKRKREVVGTQSKHWLNF